MGSNNHGLFSTDISTVSVEVLPPWWQKHVIQTLALLLFLDVNPGDSPVSAQAYSADHTLSVAKFSTGKSQSPINSGN